MKWYVALANAFVWTAIGFVGLGLFVGSLVLAIANGPVGMTIWFFLFVVGILTWILTGDKNDE